VRLTMRKLAIYAVLLLVAVVVSTAAALVALRLGAGAGMARWFAFGVLAALAVVITILMEARFS
jgi:hypothetical protein